MAADDQGEEPGGVLALLGDAAEAAEKVLELGARVQDKFRRDSTTQVKTPDDVERLGREWAELFDETARIAQKGRAMLSRLKRR